MALKLSPKTKHKLFAGSLIAACLGGALVCGFLGGTLLAIDYPAYAVLFTMVACAYVHAATKAYAIYRQLS